MTVFPLFDTVVLPNAFLVLSQSEYAEYVDGEPKTDDTVIFAVMRAHQTKAELSADNFYPIGIRSRLTDIQNGFLVFKTEDRLELSNTVIKNGRIYLSIKTRPNTVGADVKDHIAPEHYADIIMRYSAAFKDDPKIRLAFKVNTNVWGKLMSLSPLLSLTVDEKYMLLAEDDSDLRLSMVHSCIEGFIIEHSLFSDDLSDEDRLYAERFLDTPQGQARIEKFLEDVYFVKHYFRIGRVSDKVAEAFGEASDEYAVAKCLKENSVSVTLRDLSDKCGASKERIIGCLFTLADFSKKNGRDKRDDYLD